MIRCCDGSDPNLVRKDMTPCDCGAIFDDVEFMVIYPHQRVRGYDTYWSGNDSR